MLCKKGTNANMKCKLVKITISQKYLFISLHTSEIFSPRPVRRWGPPSLLYSVYWIFPGGKTAGVSCFHLPQSSAEVKERVELYLYSTSGPSLPVLGWNLPVIYLKKSRLIGHDSLFQETEANIFFLNIWKIA